jgi:predicted DNA-binding antitoxin AbrB/MazE fold protein
MYNNGYFALLQNLILRPCEIIKISVVEEEKRPFGL